MSRHSNVPDRDQDRSADRDLTEKTRDNGSDRDQITGLRDDHESSSDPGSDKGTDASNFDRYRFSLNDGKVTNLQEFNDGRWHTERIDGSESWSFDGTNLIKTEAGSHGTSVSSFTDLDGDGVFTRMNASSNSFSSGLGTSDISGLG